MRSRAAGRPLGLVPLVLIVVAATVGLLVM